MKGSDNNSTLSQTPIITNKSAFIIASLGSICGYLFYKKYYETEQTGSYSDTNTSDQEQTYFQSFKENVKNTYLYQTIDHYLEDERNDIIFAAIVAAIFLFVLILWLSKRVTFERMGNWIHRKKARFFSD